MKGKNPEWEWSNCYGMLHLIEMKSYKPKYLMTCSQQE